MQSHAVGTTKENHTPAHHRHPAACLTVINSLCQRTWVWTLFPNWYGMNTQSFYPYGLIPYSLSCGRRCWIRSPPVPSRLHLSRRNTTLQMAFQLTCQLALRRRVSDFGISTLCLTTYQLVALVLFKWHGLIPMVLGTTNTWIAVLRNERIDCSLPLTSLSLQTTASSVSGRLWTASTCPPNNPLGLKTSAPNSKEGALRARSREIIASRTQSGTW